MKTQIAVLLILCALLPATPNGLRAETDAACCRCGRFYKLSDEGFGFARHHVGFCPKCTAEMGGNLDQYLGTLRGKLRGLADAAQLTLRQIRASAAARDAARDAIYGRKGLATGFFSALMGLAAEGAGGEFKNLAKAVDEGLGWYNKAADTMAGDMGWVLDEGKDWVKDQTVGEAKKKAMLKGAAVVARRYYDQTGDARGATQKLLDAHGDIQTGVSVLESAIKFYDKTGKLADGIQKYLEERANAEREWKEWQDITNQMQAVQDEIAKLEGCRKKQQEQQRKSVGRIPGTPGRLWRELARIQGWSVIPASEDPASNERAAVKALVFPPNQPDVAALKGALSGLQQLRKELAAFRKDLEEELVPPLLPFWLDVQGDLGRNLATALLKWAHPVTGRASRQYNRVIRHGEGVSEELKRSGASPEQI
jgi:hypothetical protein